MSSLTEIADVALIHILERCDFKSLMTLRKVCKSLRKFITESHLKTDLSHLCITISPSLLQIRWPPPKDNEIQYDATHDLTLEELNTILSIQNSKLDTFEVSVHRQPKMLDCLEEILKSKPRPLQTKKLTMGGTDAYEFMKVIPYLDSDALKIIHLSSTGWGKGILDGVEELLETEQFKKAEAFKLDHFMVEKGLSKFFHFQTCDLMFDKLLEEELMALKEAFTTSTHMRQFILKATNSDRTMLKKVFGEPSSESTDINGAIRDIHIWYFEIKTCKENVLVLGSNKNKIILVKRLKSGIPDGAIIIK